MAWVSSSSHVIYISVVLISTHARSGYKAVNSGCLSEQGPTKEPGKISHNLIPLGLLVIASQSLERVCVYQYRYMQLAFLLYVQT